MPIADLLDKEYFVHSASSLAFAVEGVVQVIRTMHLPKLIWLPQEEAWATELVTKTLHLAVEGTVPEALIWGTTQLGFDSFVFGIVANDRRPDGESRTYILTNQADEWVRAYDEHAYLEVDPRVDLAQEPGYAFWEAREFDKNPRHKVFLTEAAYYGIQSGLVLGLCTRDPPSYALMALNCAAPTLDHWGAEQRLLIAGQALVLGKVLSRSVRKFLNDEELLFPVLPMKLSFREREILTLAAAGKTSKEIAMLLGIAKVTVDTHMGTIVSKMGALNRNQAIAKAIANKLIQLPDDVNAEYKSAKLQAVKKAHHTRSVNHLSRDSRH
jgi:LuxR family transcriptional regulator, quorum-sensing system regulator LasR